MVERDVADLIDHYEGEASKATELLLQATLAMGVSETGHPLGGRGEGHAVPGEAGPDAVGDRQVGLAGPRRPQEHHVAGLGEEIQLGEVGEDLAGDRLLEAEVELSRGTCGRGTGPPGCGPPHRGPTGPGAPWRAVPRRTARNSHSSRTAPGSGPSPGAS